MSTFVIEEEAYLAHYGILRKSGRYPWGSGDTQAKRNQSFLDIVESHHRDGWSQVQIAKAYGMSTTQLRALKTIAKNERKQARINQAQRLKDKGLSNVAIGERMGLNESSVRDLLTPGQKEKADILVSVANMLKEQVAEKQYIDIGKGVENYLNISSTKLNTAVAMLKEEGYTTHEFNIPQLGVKGQYTKAKILAGKGVTGSEVYKNRDQIKQISTYTQDGGRTFLGILPPISVNKNRIDVVYGDEGGAELDGVMFIRPNVEDISLGKSRYAQVRVLVGNTHYLKGMAIYKNDLPPGVDIQFNTNKPRTNNKLDAMKKVTGDPDNPFGAQISSQIFKIDKTGKQKVTSAMNILNEEGDWLEWSKSLSAQILSKQNPKLAKSQLNMTYEKKLKDFEDIMNLTNPTVRKKLLETFADDVDSSAVHLKAAALPRQATHVILPVNSIPDNQVYAPNFRNGEKVVLIRFPHGGIFEIPELTVNNNHAPSKKLLGNAKDAIGINTKVAQQLSGADFDGDTVLVIPNNNKKLQAKPPLEGLKNFDPQKAYPAYPGMKPISPRTKQIQMGDVSNLITDMTIRGANMNEIAQAVRHSMVIIDAEKHNLDYRQSLIDNNIRNLKQKYQGKSTSGATTIISRATSPINVPKRKQRPAAKGGPIDKATGKRVFEYTNESFVNSKGQVIQKVTVSKKLAETDDAFTLSSGTPIETIYADHSNKLKALANQARKEAVNTPRAKYSPSAKKVYADEVNSLNSKLYLALRNAPLERQAQIIANGIIKQKRDANPDIDETSLKKLKAQALNEARNRTGAKKQKVAPTPKEWEAIQAGAITDSKLVSILANGDLDVVRDLATPKKEVKMTSAKTNRAKAMLESGYSRRQIADALGVSLSTLDKATV